MTTSQCALALAVVGWLATGQAQPTHGTHGTPTPPAAEMLLGTRFRTPLTYDAALARLDEYYDEQIGRKSAAAFPRIGPKQHFELWHDMWVTFDPAEGGVPAAGGVPAEGGVPAAGGTLVTLKRQADRASELMVKGWMLNLAGKVDSALPLEFKQEPPLHRVEGDLYASPRDLARVLESEASMKTLPTWEHAGLTVSARPLVSVIMAPAGSHGIHHLIVHAETAAAARQLLNRILQGVLKPGIYAAYSEDSEVEREIGNAAKGQADSVAVTSAQAIFIQQMDPKSIEGRLRADPEMHKRALAAQGQYDIRFRIDKPYRTVLVRWIELTGYSRADGKHRGERPLGQCTIAAPKMLPQPGSHLIARTKLENLKPGAYRVNLEGESPTGELLKIDERTYWFDGKSFEEI